MLEVFSTCLVLEQSVAPTNSSPPVPLVVSSLPHRTTSPNPPPGAISWSVVCTRSKEKFLPQLAPPPRRLVTFPSYTDQRQCSSSSSICYTATDTKFYELTSEEVYEFLARYHTHPSEYFPRFTKPKHT